jgi:hypothetical protein
MTITPRKYFTIYLSECTELFSHMTARPLDPDSRRKPVYAAVTLVLVMAAVLLAAGCVGCALSPTGCMDSGAVPDNHIKVIKLTQDATVEWSTVLDSGGNNRVYRIIRTPDNNLAVYCVLEKENFDGLVKLSGTDGKVLWKTPLFYETGCGPYLAPGNNGDIIVSGGTNICRINPDGIIVWNHTTQLNSTISSIMETPENGYLIGGTRMDKFKFNTGFHYDESGNLIQEYEIKDRKEFASQTSVGKIDTEGNIVWQTFLGNENFHDPAQIIFNKTQGTDYIIQTESAVIRLDQNGKFLNATTIDSIPEADNATFSRPSLMKHLNYPWNSDLPPRVIFYDKQGFAVAKLTFQNSSRVISPADDGGYLSAFIADRKNPDNPDVTNTKPDERLHIIRMNPDGSKARDILVNGIVVTDVKGIIRTSDGGYALVCMDEVWNENSDRPVRHF